MFENEIYTFPLETRKRRNNWIISVLMCWCDPRVTCYHCVIIIQDISTSPDAGGIHFNKKSPGASLGSLSGLAGASDLDKLKSEAGAGGILGQDSGRLYSDTAMANYGKLGSGAMAESAAMYGAGDYSRLMAGAGAGPDYSKLMGSMAMGSGPGLYHSFMQNPYMTGQLNMATHQAATLPNLPSSY